MHAYFLLGGPIDQMEAFKAEQSRKRLVRGLEVVEFIIQPSEFEALKDELAPYTTRVDLESHPFAVQLRQQFGLTYGLSYARGFVRHDGDPTKRTHFVNLNYLGLKVDYRLRFHTPTECRWTDAL